MNRRTVVVFSLIFAAAALHAQDKATPPKAEKVTEKAVEKPANAKPATAKPAAEKPTSEKSEKSEKQPKVLTFQPDAATPAATHGETGPKPGQPNPMLDGPSQMVATFFGALRDGRIDEGYATLTKGSNIAEKPEELKQLKAKTREAIEVFGAINGFDFVESRAIGQRLVRATYASQGRVFPLRWRFYFYKPEEVWRIIDLRVDDKLTGIFDEIPEVKTLDVNPADASAK